MKNKFCDLTPQALDRLNAYLAVNGFRRSEANHGIIRFRDRDEKLRWQERFASPSDPWEAHEFSFYSSCMKGRAQ